MSLVSGNLLYFSSKCCLQWWKNRWCKILHLNFVKTAFSLSGSVEGASFSSLLGIPFIWLRQAFSDLNPVILSVFTKGKIYQFCLKSISIWQNKTFFLLTRHNRYFNRDQKRFGLVIEPFPPPAHFRDRGPMTKPNLNILGEGRMLKNIVMFIIFSTFSIKINAFTHTNGYTMLDRVETESWLGCETFWLGHGMHYILLRYNCTNFVWRQLLHACDVNLFSFKHADTATQVRNQAKLRSALRIFSKCMAVPEQNSLRLTT